MEVVESTSNDFVVVAVEEAQGYIGVSNPCLTGSMGIFGLVCIPTVLEVCLLLDKVYSDEDFVVQGLDLRYRPLAFAKMTREFDLKGVLGQI